MSPILQKVASCLEPSSSFIKKFGLRLPITPPTSTPLEMWLMRHTDHAYGFRYFLRRTLCSAYWSLSDLRRSSLASDEGTVQSSYSLPRRLRRRKPAIDTLLAFPCSSDADLSDDSDRVPNHLEKPPPRSTNRKRLPCPSILTNFILSETHGWEVF